MASFRKDKTTSANTAIMTAGGIVQALVAAGKVTTLPKAQEAFETLFDAAFAKASPVVDEDNALFAQVEADSPAPAAKSSGGSTRSSGGSKGKGGAKPADVAGALVLNSGPFKDMTIEDVYGLDADTAKEEKGYTHGSGADYVSYLTSEDNPNGYTRDAAAAFLEQAA